MFIKIDEIEPQFKIHKMSENVENVEKYILAKQKDLYKSE